MVERLPYKEDVRSSSLLTPTIKKEVTAPLFFMVSFDDENFYLKFGGFADGRSVTSPDSEQIELTVAKPQMRNSVSVEQIQEKSSNAHH